MMKDNKMKQTDIYRDAVLQKISHGKKYSKSGSVTFSIENKHYHIKVKTGHLKKYPFNINPTVLEADFEVYVCGDDNLYYVIPMTLIKEMHTDPFAMPDHRYDGYTVVDVHPHENIIKYGTGGKYLNIEKYRNINAQPLYGPRLSSKKIS
jgi:hypothetical protein